MSESILKSYVDERGNISVRVSHEVQVLTREEADRIEAEYKRMQAENAKLREEFDKMDVWHSKELTAAMAENAKLRELVRDMMRFFEDGDYCTVCEKAAECDAQEEYDDSCLMRGVFHARMRELGVDDGSR